MSSDNPSAVKPVLERVIADQGTVRQTEQGFEIEAELEGESARDLTRIVLSELRRAEKRTGFAPNGHRVIPSRDFSIMF